MKGFDSLKPVILHHHNLHLQDTVWLKDIALQRVLDTLNQDGEEALIVGGAVRNALLKKPVYDIDIATTALPEIISNRAEKAGFRMTTEGRQFGTIRIITNRKVFEVTTLREDITTDGRHAQVRFGRDWYKDAQRRDFTINAFYMDGEGNIYDPLGNIEDIINKRISFIGDPEQRIREDYLRILRFFRFFAYYGNGRPDSEGLKQSAILRQNLLLLSKERIWQELVKLLAAPNPMRALRWMRQIGILTLILPETEKWGIDEVETLIKAEQHYHWEVDPILRLKAMLPPQTDMIADLGKRLKLSAALQKDLLAWAKLMPSFLLGKPESWPILFYYNDQKVISACLKLQIAILGSKIRDQIQEERFCYYCDLLEKLLQWQRPKFPLTGNDLLAQGYKKGAKLGSSLKVLEREWCSSQFLLSKEALLAKAKAL